MKRHSKSDSLSQYRGQIDADDGRDPREIMKQEHRPRVTGRKAQQLASQVAQSLQQLFAESADVGLQSLRIVHVAPAPDAAQLLVLIAPAIGAELDADAALPALAKASGWLRSEMAKAVTRKRAPQLLFSATKGRDRNLVRRPST